VAHTRPPDAVSTTALAATALLAVGALRTGVDVPLLPTVAVVIAAASLRRWRAAPAIALIGVLTDLAFARAPYAQLQLRGTHPLEALVVCAVTAVVAAALGLLLVRIRPRQPRCVVCAVEQSSLRADGRSPRHSRLVPGR
jgi:hypothetical protein